MRKRRLSFFHAVFTFDHGRSTRRLQLGLKERREFLPVREVYEYGARHNRSASQTMPSIFQRALHTHADLRRERRKSIREPSPFTFISHLFLIPPPFWSFLFPLALPRLLFHQLQECAKYILNQSVNGLKDSNSNCSPSRHAEA